MEVSEVRALAIITMTRFREEHAGQKPKFLYFGPTEYDAYSRAMEEGSPGPLEFSRIPIKRMEFDGVMARMED